MRKILLVDDSHDVRQLFLKSSEQWPELTIDAAANAQVAAEMVSANKYDLAIVNPVLSRNSGIEFIYDIKTYADTADMPLVLLADSPQDYADLVLSKTNKLNIKLVVPRLDLNPGTIHDACTA